MSDPQLQSSVDQRPSRYRSVRKAEAAAATPPSSAQAENIGRSRSRYHHNRPATAQNPPPPSQSPIAGQEQYNDLQQQDSIPSRTLSSRDGPSSRYHGRHAQQQDTIGGAQDPYVNAPELQPQESEEEEARTRERQQKYDRAKPADPVKAAERYGDPPKNIRAKRAPQNPNKNMDDSGSDDEAQGGCFGIFKKKKPAMNTAHEKNSSARTPPSRYDGPPTIKPGGGGVVPGTDAPVSAVNAGDRRVLVECNKSSMYFPITPETTPTDLIQSAANVMSENIDVRSSVLMEYFSTVGVQRPLRRYEHVRDVMNSWNDDRANSLLLVPSRAVEVNPAALGASSVPTAKPVECTFLMSYSQKPGSWDKRHITIRTDGQIVMSKNPKDKDALNICHLSDYDIYTPTAKQLSKKIKPPKRICFAIKSQEKTSMFESRSNYVHFFCTNDRAMGESYYDAVQGWRSWYLVNVLGKGKKQPQQPQQTDLKHSPSRAQPPRDQNSHAHHPSTSTMASHYQLGSYKPLMDMDQFDKRPISSHSQKNHNPQHQDQISRKLSTRDRSHPPTSYPKAKLAEDEPLINITTNRTSEPLVKSDSNDFASDGLLGRSYSTRQRQQAERDEASKSPFTNGLHSDTLNRQTSINRHSSTRRPSAPTAGPIADLRRNASTRDRNRGSVDLGRSTSVRGAREMPKPLVDLTPTYKPPPQHVKKGRGHYPENVGPGGLVEAATSGEVPLIAVPPQHDWRGRVVAQETMPRSRSRSNVVGAQGRQYSPAGQTAAGRGREGSGGDEQAFTGGVFLGSSQHGYGSVGAGAVRGGGTGGRNASGGTQPLIDVSEASHYAPGSLLAKVAQVEQQEGRGGPVIDRDV